MVREVEYLDEKYYMLHQVEFCFQIIFVAFATDLMKKVSPAKATS